MLDYIAYPAFACRIRRERKVQGFAKLTGSQRPVGLIFPGDALRQVFLGTLVLGDESAGDAIWPRPRPRRRRLGRADRRPTAGGWSCPRPPFESLIDVIELVPACLTEYAR